MRPRWKNIALFRWPIEDPRMARFVARVQPINELADQSDGFVWRFMDDYTPLEVGPPWNDPLLFFNMSVWRNLDSLLAFVRSPQHMTMMSNRSEFIAPVRGPSAALWWIDEGNFPTVDDAIEAISRIASQGETLSAFSAGSRYGESKQ